MSEWLIRVVDKINDDPILDAGCLKRGDVVAVCPDGWQWSRAELDNPHWRVLKLPGIHEAEARGYLQAEVNTDPRNPSAFLRSRAFGLDLDSKHLTAQVREWMQPDHPEQAVAKSMSGVAIGDLNARIRLRKPAAVDPQALT